MQKLVVILCCLIFISCKKEANIKLPDTKPLPVLYSYISPADSVIRLKLMYSSPLYASNQIDIQAPVSNADVKISSAQGTAQLNFNPNTEYYELNAGLYPILPGQVYRMTVTTNRGDVATAVTEVPVTVVPITALTVEAFTGDYEISDRIKISFTDEPGRANFYRFGAQYSTVNYLQDDTLTTDTYISELYNDVNHDGANVSLVGVYYQGYYSDTTSSAEFYDVFLFNCSASYYNFHKSMVNYTGEDPFSAPSLIYTNVEGGFGCFGAYTSSVQRYYK